MLSSDDAHGENWYDLGSGCAPPPSAEVSSGAPSPPAGSRCLLIMLTMKTGTIWALGVPPPNQKRLGPAPGPSPDVRCLLMMLVM